MADNRIDTTFSSTYKDDWDKDDHYHRILFNNGRALQARELTQMQTIIQEEMARFGRNIFKEGAAVNTGVANIDSAYRFVDLATTDLSTLITALAADAELRYIDATNNVVVRVLAVDDTLNRIYVQYLDNGGSGNTAFTTVADGSTLNAQVGFNNGGAVVNLTAAASNAAGLSVKVTYSEGDFFIDGHFVHSSEQSLIISQNSQSVDETVGFVVEKKIISVNDDQDLYDNAGNVVNTASPGADRYQINLLLKTAPEAASSYPNDTFVFLARIENSVIVEQVDGQDDYSKIADMIAERTKEESGSYVVDPFTFSVEEGSVTDSSMSLLISDGLAYVNGYRVHKQSPTKLTLPKPKETETITSEGISVSYGNYFIISSFDLGTTDGGNLFNSGITPQHQEFTINNGGTCKLRHFGLVNGEYRAYVYYIEDDVNLSAATTLTSGQVSLTIDTSQPGLQEVANNDAFEKLSLQRAAAVADNSIQTIVQRSFNFTSSGTTQTLTATDGTPVNPAQWILWNDTDGTSDTVTWNGTQLTGLTTAKNYVILFNVQQNAGTTNSRTKTLASTTVTAAMDVDGNGRYYLDLNQYDILSVDSVCLGTSAGPDATRFFTLDNGQRDNYYSLGKLVLDSALEWTGDVYANFKYFNRTQANTDRFYSAQSYVGNIPGLMSYGDIPKHKLTDGTEISLVNYLDFRPDIDRSGTVTNEFSFPRNGSNVIADTSYYLPRADKLLLNEQGEVQLLMGQQAQEPQFKKTPDNALELYKIVLNANPQNEEDMNVTPVEHKHYTMADIAHIDEKVDKLADYVSLSFLELEAKFSTLRDSAGDARAETGIVVDDGSDQTLSDVENPDYCASIDPDSKLIRACFDDDNVRLVWDQSLNGSAVTKVGDMVMLSYEDSVWMEQPSASETFKVNPTGQVDNIGCLMLSPSSDEWKNSTYDAVKALPGSRRLGKKQRQLWNSWKWNWTGRNIENNHQPLGEDQFVPSNAKYGAFGRKALKEIEQYNSTRATTPNRLSTNRSVTRIISDNTLRTRIGGRIIDLGLIPWMRSRKIYFKAMGLKPNTVHKAFFDGVNVSEFCKNETSFVRWSDTTNDYSTQYDYTGFNEHPDGTEDLLSDDEGEVIGSFYIPSVRPSPKIRTFGITFGEVVATSGKRFRAGVKEFKLVDVSENDVRTADSKAVAYYTVKGAIPVKKLRMMSTRAADFAAGFYPTFEGSYPTNVYNERFISEDINAVGSAYVNLDQPHLAGQWGASTGTVAPGSYVGNMGQILDDYVSINQLTYGSESSAPLPSKLKPMAQSFFVDNPFGLTMTSVSLYFSAKDSKLPVSIRIAPIVNGAPSSIEAVPGSCAYLKPASVNTSTDATTPTVFTFEEPVYLNPWTQYAIVIASQSNQYSVYTGTARKFQVGSSQITVATRGGSGKFYLPQSGVRHVGENQIDLKFKINRCVFTGGSGTLGGHNGSVILRNAEPAPKLLVNNPLKTTNASDQVYVKLPCHGFSNGDNVVISGATATGGISAANINGTRTVVNLDAHGYVFTAGAAASSTTTGGGGQVLSTRQVSYNIVEPYIETLVPPRTSADFSARYMDGQSIGGSETKYVLSSTYKRTTPHTNTEFPAPKTIVDPVNRVRTSPYPNNNYSAYIKVDLKTSNNYVSPFVDLQRASLITIGNCIDDSDGRSIYTVDELVPYGNSNASRHIMTPVQLTSESVGFDVRLNYILNQESNFDFYFRTGNAADTLAEQTWTRLDPLSDYVKSGTRNEAEFLSGGLNGSMKPFTQFQGKYVMHTTNSSNVPKLSELKIKFLAN